MFLFLFTLISLTSQRRLAGLSVAPFILLSIFSTPSTNAHVRPFPTLVAMFALWVGCEWTVVADTLFTSPISDLVFHRALRARRATFSNVGSPVSRLSVANSRMKVPTPAVQVTGVSVGLTPRRRFTVPYGMPVGVSNADLLLRQISLIYSCVLFKVVH